MSEQTIKYRITAFVDPANQSLSLDVEGLAGKFSREVMNVKERVVRQGLIALGWTPPGLADKLFTACKNLQDGHPTARHVIKNVLAAYENHKKKTP